MSNSKVEGQVRAIPLCLPEIHPDTKLYQLKLQSNALNILLGIKGKIVVILVCGLARTGKSYLLSLFINKQGNAFPLGHTEDAHTKGIWMYPIPLSIKLSNREDATLVLLDTEGIGHAGSGKENDYSIMVLSVLLSSTLIYNVKGIFSSNDIDVLHTTINLAKNLCKETTTGLIERDQLFATVPSLAVVIRDDQFKQNTEKFLRVTLAGDPLSPNDSEKTRAQLREELESQRNFFAVGIKAPSLDEEVLENITSPENAAKLNPAFVQDLKEFCGRVIENALPKTSPTGLAITGQEYVGLAIAYVEALNRDGTLPAGVVGSTWSRIVESNLAKASEEAFKQYSTNFKPPVLPVAEAEITKQHTKVQGESLTFFEDRIRSVKSNEFERQYQEALQQLKKKMEEHHQYVLNENRRESRSRCEKLFNDKFSQYLGSVVISHTLPDNHFQSLVDQVRRDYNTDAAKLGPAMVAVLQDNEKTLTSKQEILQAKLQTAKSDEKARAAEEQKLLEERKRKDEERLRKQAEEILRQQLEIQRQKEAETKRLADLAAAERKRLADLAAAAETKRLADLAAAEKRRKEEEEKMQVRGICSLSVKGMNAYLDVMWGHTHNGNKIWLYEGNGTASQSFNFLSDGTIVAQRSNLKLGFMGKVELGSQLVIGCTPHTFTLDAQGHIKIGGTGLILGSNARKDVIACLPSQGHIWVFERRN